MKKTITTLVLLGFSILVTAQKSDTVRRYLDEELTLTSKLRAVYAAVSIRSDDHWMLYAVYPDTSMLLKAYFSDKELTIKDGPFTLYHPKNKKAMEGIYLRNGKQGVWRYWFPNGQLKDSGMMYNNQLTGEWKSWNEKGELLTKATYLDIEKLKNRIAPQIQSERKRGILADDVTDGELNGVFISYHPDGQIKDSGKLVAGIRQGDWYSYYATGTKDNEGHFLNGNMEGAWTFYHENGAVSTKEIYKNNKIVDLSCFDEKGNAMGSFCSILKPPVPLLDRFTDFNTYMLDNIMWPKELDGKNVSGLVKAHYTISKTGEMISFTVDESPHPSMTAEVERFFKTLTKWSPAIIHNRALEYTAKIEIPFYR